MYSEIEWPPINVTYEKAVCRVDYDDGEAGLYTSVIVLLDNASNARMEAFVRRFSHPLLPRRHPHLPPCLRSTDGSLLRRPMRSHEPELQRLQQIAALDPLPSPRPLLDESDVLRVVQRTFTLLLYVF